MSLGNTMEGINETKLGMPADYYIPSIFVANKDDSITMHFYNLDAANGFLSMI
jgi:hypothetical protein